MRLLTIFKVWSRYDIVTTNERDQLVSKCVLAQVIGQCKILLCVSAIKRCEILFFYIDAHILYRKHARRVGRRDILSPAHYIERSAQGYGCLKK